MHERIGEGFPASETEMTQQKPTEPESEDLGKD